MRNRFKLIIGLVILTTLVMLSISWLKGGISEAQVSTSALPVSTKQLVETKGRIPVGLKCSEAKLSSPYSLEEIHCEILNNTKKNIVSLVMIYDISLDRIGKSDSFSSAVAVDILIHPNFYRERQGSFIKSGTNSPVEILPINFEPDVLIKGVDVQIDFVEFEDNSVINKNGSGAAIIRELRSGADIYKREITKKFKENEKSEVKLKEQIKELNPRGDSNLGNMTSRQIEGASIVKRYIQRIYKTKGIDGVKRILINDGGMKGENNED